MYIFLIGDNVSRDGTRLWCLLVCQKETNKHIKHTSQRSMSKLVTPGYFLLGLLDGFLCELNTS